ncbi:UNVERIFIED_CONTAM: Pentatricopeptide repeat-containing protein, chloroplastic [Sesamum latifolium]|uniref:Pentatricopeptide repeat-containing protein, chloroplastic n=1 Tax=Sesamum latifolium TaxID=2727402 RepID=A0AAW2V239_9LAMI
MVVQEIRPNEITLASVLPAFRILGNVLMGKSVHCYWIKHNSGDNVFVETGLVDMYAKFGCMRSARNLFDDMSVKNVVSWNAIISGYSDNGFGKEALWMFSQMRRKGFSADSFTLMSLVSLEDLRVGSGIHSLIVRSGYENDKLLKTALMELYINCNFVTDAYSIFRDINNKDLVAWTLMLKGFSKSGNWKRTMDHFNTMMAEDEILLDSVSLITILSGCCSGALQQGRRVHALVIKTGFEADTFVGSAVIDMYANCASMEDAKRHFESMEEKDVACWNALISGYGMIGCGNEAIELFLKMKHSGLNPDDSTFVSVLCASSHAGLNHKNFELGVEISRELFQLKPNDAGYYVLLSNMYALAGNWACARMPRIFLKLNNLKKNPGLSAIEIRGEFFTFMASQTDHPNYSEIKEFLRGLILKIKAAGYEPDTNSVFLDVSDDVKKEILFHHSEKLAIAFGLMRTNPGTVIRINKNLRICNDCHTASKFISKVYARVLAIKDANRFHVFQDGICSCRDWW